jgi:hypothetical protein
MEIGRGNMVCVVAALRHALTLLNIPGDLMFFKVLTTPMLIISPADIAFDLMNKRSVIYSD